jgi:hypothetical protein
MDLAAAAERREDTRNAAAAAEQGPRDRDVGEKISSTRERKRDSI